MDRSIYCNLRFLGAKAYMLTVPLKINCKVSLISGMDCLAECLNKDHFRNYGKKITYRYNSQGFRDVEWSRDLSNVIWCVGDSFTVGIGQPFEETWPKLLEARTGKTCMNVGEDGCSNDNIALRAQEIYRLHNPKLIVVMWSYLHRRRVNNINIHYDKNSFGFLEDIQNFLKNFKIVNNLSTNIVNLIIPNACLFGNKKLSDHLLELNITDLLFFPQLDYARDYHHFDIQTGNYVCDLILKKIDEFDKISK